MGAGYATGSQGRESNTGAPVYSAPGKMRRPTDLSIAWPLGLVVTLSGASALILQVVWQRVISMNSGVDLTSTTTVVAGFLAGLGIGSLAGGRLADHLGPRRSVVAFAASNAGVALFAWFSTDLFYGLSRDAAPQLDSRPASFAFNFSLLLVPTVLEGLSLPFVARAVSARFDGASARIARLYGVNTFGAAIGAVLAGWYLMGTFGFVTTTRLAAAANLAAAALLVVIARRWRTVDAPAPDAPDPTLDAVADAPIAAPAADGRGSGSIRGWYLAYAAFGAIALAFQQVFFRLIDAIVRSNSHSFSLVLAIYLGVWGLGSALGSALLRRTRDHRSWFLWLQFSSGLAGIAGYVLVVRVAPHLGLGAVYERWFRSDGFVSGIARDQVGDIALFALGIPAVLMGVPILLLGAAYPFAQSVVARDPRTVARRTGALTAANIIGSVVGTLVAGFVLIDWLGTAGTFRGLCVVLGAVGVWASSRRGLTVRTRATGLAAVVVLLALVAAAPSNDRLWAFIVGSDLDRVDVAEDHSCASVYEFLDGDGITLSINGAGQNGYPFDDFHVLIGLLPVLVHGAPADNLAVGFGVGSTTVGSLTDPRVRSTTTVELCGGNYTLARRRADWGEATFRRLFDDRRSTLLTGDGRKHLLTSGERYDTIVVDTLRPTTANAGSHFSKELYELADERLADDGILAEWAPSARVINAAASVFPHVVTATVETYSGSVLFLASRSPIDVDPAVLLQRFDALDATWFAPGQAERLRDFIAGWRPTCIVDGEPLADVPGPDINLDLRPRDEYPFNNDVAPAEDALRTC